LKQKESAYKRAVFEKNPGESSKRKRLLFEKQRERVFLAYPEKEAPLVLGNVHRGGGPFLSWCREGCASRSPSRKTDRKRNASFSDDPGTTGKEFTKGVRAFSERARKFFREARLVGSANYQR